MFFSLNVESYLNNRIFRVPLDLLRYCTLQRRKQLGIVFILMCLSGLSESLTVGAVLPFIGALVAPERLLENDYFEALSVFFGFYSVFQVQLFITVIFCGLAIIAAIIRLTLIKITASLARDIGSDFHTIIFRQTLRRPFVDHLAQNSSVIQAGLKKVDRLAANFIIPLMSVFTSVVSIFAVMVLLAFIQPLVTVIIVAGFGSIYVLISLHSKSLLSRNGGIVAQNAQLLFQIVQESLGSIRDIKLGGTEDFHVEKFSNTTRDVQGALAGSQLIANLPKHLIEGFGIVVLAVVSLFFVSSGNSMLGLLPLLATFALGAQRILPMLNNAYSSFSTLVAELQSVHDILEIVKQDVSQKKKNSKKCLDNATFESGICLEKISFKYPNSKYSVFKGLSCKIRCGQVVGLVGESGSGKSTLLNVLLGLLFQDDGEILIDGKRLGKDVSFKWWSSVTTHVPQSIFLIDDTIARNIAFSQANEKIDYKRLELVAQISLVENFAKNWPDKLETKVGENGARLSGGQRQRIGIARALYKEAKFLVFDEATNALDMKTEFQLMLNVKKAYPHITMLIVSHEETKLEQLCDFTLKLKKNKSKGSKYEIER